MFGPSLSQVLVLLSSLFVCDVGTRLLEQGKDAASDFSDAETMLYHLGFSIKTV